MKLKKLLAVGACAFVLGACSSDQENNNNQDQAQSTEQTSQQDNNQQQQEQQSQEQKPEVDPKYEGRTYPAEAYWNFEANGDVVANTMSNQYKVKSINKDTGAMTGAPIIWLELEYTNNGQQPQSPYMAFVVDFDVSQTDGTTTQTLNGANGELGNVPNQEAVEMGDAQVNPGKSVDAVIGYRLAIPDDDVLFSLRSGQGAFAWANE
ncbi:MULTISPECIES: DUF5067 domain-containing protein [Aerococcus]|uniref:DUF5067 domain-containing protein n=1 Tax=Aerococcus TaxID=1375 RepID=UPI000DCBBD3A|nr:DUF5067 domain-containing protein [Aerococcus urinae]RAV95361.1 hypothetical protein DBT53_04470 [Aerococcus mictus]MDK6292642.1 DUF5067 domain-containing protein [Aerococcus urinae]MDK6374356.1 DUF5067 domain-containing protein [Aerococcus urinae]MDK6421634.1 DUF5067 domain-containing protein [Aerococcus urinae]MDK8074992.1 DUF5067 domain-containing protein [Aerococcus urinae]